MFNLTLVCSKQIDLLFILLFLFGNTNLGQGT